MATPFSFNVGEHLISLLSIVACSSLTNIQTTETLLSTGILEIPEINNEGVGIEYGPGIYQVLCRLRIR